MDYFYDNPQAIAMPGSGYEGMQDTNASTSSSIKNSSTMFQYTDANSDSFQPPDQNWIPFDFEDMEDYADDLPQLSAPGSTASSTDTEKGTGPNTKMRRRAQNRASQRAFRERKDKHLKGLEYQLETLNEKHQDLLQSYMKQSESVIKLNSRLSELRSEIKSVQSLKSPPVTTSSTYMQNQRETVDSFDAFSFTSPYVFPLNERQESMFWQDEASLHAHNDELPGFEDLLHLT